MKPRIEMAACDSVEALVTILGTVGVVVFVVLVMAVPHQSAKVNSLEHRVSADSRHLHLAIMNYAYFHDPHGSFEVPSTWNLIYPFLVEQSAGAEYKAGPHVDSYKMGELTTTDMMTGAVSADRIVEVAQQLGVPDQSWEFVMGYWLSRISSNFDSKNDGVIIGVMHQVRYEINVSVVILANGSIVYGDDDHVGLKKIRKTLSINRDRRERLNLPPMPPEFESFLLTGEPASVGDGTFVPPMIQ